MSRSRRKTSPQHPPSGPRVDVAPMVLANVLGLAAFPIAWFIHGSDPPLYAVAVREDGLVEWATFLAFVGSSVVFAMGALRQWRATQLLPWFLAGLSLFCAIVAMEEISWGQRLLGYRPPDYFLQQNFQQELNFHNVMGTGFRELAMHVILIGYGVLLPLLFRFRAVSMALERWAIIPPPLAMAPLFAVSSLVYYVYPWRSTGEWVELSMACGFLFAGQLGAGAKTIKIAGSFVGVMLVAAVLAHASDGSHVSDPERVDLARAELAALGADFGRSRSPCQQRPSVRTRVYTLVEMFDAEHFTVGAFAAQVAGTSAERARYFLDPWNAPYWFQCRRDTAGRVHSRVFSSGPNRRPDSTFEAVLGDDLGADF